MTRDLHELAYWLEVAAIMFFMALMWLLIVTGDRL